MAKAEEVAKYKGRFANYDYKQLEQEAMKIANGLIASYPNVWQKKLKDNAKHTAIYELMTEIRDAKQEN